ncbi:MAG: bifunctional 2-C-methyl-D-erythritol 4-phosphate cytidylyltransferase/2-C-methyl-D-erythritol 2,4-cyclodiphosphate synthase [Rhodospirillaceae bacterium]|nr:bifunctional 2-C-methyl-D-erythritol 4-phosphate cytidylyltransferase/2-C-methyl-D-erythritol 2,4-cyclodiphosphate synthase [Rhodospirillaceae bacterium]
MPETVALIVAAGRGSRMPGDVPKQYRHLHGRAILRHVLEAFVAHPGISAVHTVIHPDDAERFADVSRGLNLGVPVPGGETRQESVRNGLESLAAETSPEKVLIHDGARPFVSPALIDRVIDALDRFDGAVPALPMTDTVKRVSGDAVVGTVDRSGLFRAQTPQGFRFPALLSAHGKAAENMDGQSFTDDASVAEAAGLSISVIAGEESNIKITHDDDMARAAAWLRGARETRVGSGFDVHAFGPGNSVRLGGIDIAHSQALAGHSDADVALHALTDAILGAIGDGDIGSPFPPSDPQWQGADSSQFLAHAANLLRQRSGTLVHADLTIICEQPRIGAHRDAMRARIAEILAIDASRVSVKATTTEGLGFTGRNEGIAAQASVTVTVEESA